MCNVQIDKKTFQNWCVGVFEYAYTSFLTHLTTIFGATEATLKLANSSKNPTFEKPCWSVRNTNRKIGLVFYSTPLTSTIIVQCPDLQKNLSKLMCRGLWTCLYLVFDAFNHHVWKPKHCTDKTTSNKRKQLGTVQASWTLTMADLGYYTTAQSQQLQCLGLS